MIEPGAFYVSRDWDKPDALLAWQLSPETATRMRQQVSTAWEELELVTQIADVLRMAAVSIDAGRDREVLAVLLGELADVVEARLEVRRHLRPPLPEIN